MREKRERGVALFLAIFALLLLSAVGLGMLFSSDTETMISVNYRDKQKAIYGALAGLQEARDRLHPLSGDLGVGTNLSAGGLGIAPTALPTSSNAGVLYLLNPAPGETVAPWDPTNAYFDDELCHESYFVNNLSVTTVAAGTPCPKTSASVPSGTGWYKWYSNSSMQTSAGASGTGDAATIETAYQLTDSSGNKVPLTYKWARIMLKADNMTPIAVGTGNGTQVCWDGSHEKQLPTGYHTDCTPPSGGVTNVAVTVSGAGYTATPTVTISGGGGSGAAATATVGQLPVGISSVTLTNPGGGYTRAPAVTVTPADGLGSGAQVNATLNATVPVSSVSVTSSPTACYTHGSVPSISFSAGSPTTAVGTVVMAPYNCVYTFAGTGKCASSGNTANVSGAGGFAGNMTAASNKKVAGSEVVTNAGSNSYGSLSPALTGFTVTNGSGNCVTSPASAALASVTTGDTISSVTITTGGAYPAGSPPTVSFGGAVPKGGTPTATANLSSTVNPSGLSGLNIPFGYNGSGYDVNPILTIAPPCTPLSACGGTQATGTASIATDYGVLNIQITNPGTGYSPNNPPTVTISGGGGSGATAVATVGSSGNYMAPTYLLTALAVTPTGARAMLQSEAAATYNQFTLGLGGALTLIGPPPASGSGTTYFGTPHSMPFQMIGTDCPTCATAPTGCNTTAVPARDAIGVYDPTGASSPSAVQDVITSLAKPNNYIGANSAPDVHNANLGSMTATELDAFVDSVASVGTNVYGTRAAPTSNPTINLGTAANPAIDVIYGDYSMGPSTGYGILVVTGTLSFSGNYSWNGLILVIGGGASVMSGGGNGQIIGAVYVANTSGGTLNTPSVNWNGGGGNGIQYDHCWADFMLSKVPSVPSVSPNSLQAISLRTEVY